MPYPTDRLTAEHARQHFLDAQQQAMQAQAGLLGLGGLGQAYGQAPAYVDRSVPKVKLKKEPKNFREELQVETDEWLDL